MWPWIARLLQCRSGRSNVCTRTRIFLLGTAAPVMRCQLREGPNKHRSVVNCAYVMRCGAAVTVFAQKSGEIVASLSCERARASRISRPRVRPNPHVLCCIASAPSLIRANCRHLMSDYQEHKEVMGTSYTFIPRLALQRWDESDIQTSTASTRCMPPY